MNSEFAVRVSRVGFAILSMLAFSASGAAVVKLNDVPAYEWWYGSSPTVAGMMMGFYDRNGHNGLRYDDLVAGGVAELNTFPSTPGNWDSLAQKAIASSGHATDFYAAGFGGSGDDSYLGRQFDSLADYMGTSQDSAGNVNGTTTFFYFTNGARITAGDLLSYGVHQSDGMYGMWEYFDSRGYGSGSPGGDFFTQRIPVTPGSGGFTFADFVVEIDAGRPVMIHLEGHDVLGLGYDDSDQSVYIYDTWTSGESVMTWGGAYESLSQWGVTGFVPTGGTAPTPATTPATLALLGAGIAGLLASLRRKIP